ncbi:MAG TPA: DHA2 family efflux MFS transporter permease subunit [Caulobacteraceae bacterium]|jgi:DHA2 family multidrug resistance protein
MLARRDQGAPNKWAITVSIMLATIMNSLDTTIANVALPHIQGSVSASQDQITWVLTSYIVAATIMTPMTGWLSGRIGRKQVFLISIAGFTVASMACGAAGSLVQIVGFRLMQGFFGAALIPLSQAVLLDIWPKEQHGQAMAIWGMGALLGPIMGPALGGYLTDNLNWRWVFYINLPIGILAYLGVWTFISGNKHDIPKPFDFFGFGMMSVFIGAFQLMLDRGPTQDWFGSTEIWTEAVVAGLALYMFVVHSATTKNPFFDRAIIADRSFVVASVVGFFLGILLYSSMALLPSMLEGLMGYPVVTTGLVMMPRGAGAFIGMFLVGRIVGKVDSRLLVLGGFVLTGIAAYQMSHFSLEMTSRPVIVSAVVQGLGTSMIFVPLTTLAFASLNPIYRADGSALFTLIRNLGSSAGISIVEALQTNNVELIHSDLVKGFFPGSQTLASLPAGMNPATTAGAAALNAEVTRQSAMVAYVDDFKLMLIITFVTVPLLLLLKAPRVQKMDPEHAVME